MIERFHKNAAGLIAAGLILFSGFPVMGAPSAVEVWATIEVNGYTFSRATKEALTTNAYSFKVRCVLSKGVWFMENHAPDNAVHYFYCDGTNTFQTFAFTKDNDPGNTNLQRTLKGAINGSVPGLPSFVTIIPSIHPLDDITVNAPWMAYCSASYLDQPDRLIPLPGPWIIRQAPYAFGYTDKTVRFRDGLGLPRVVELYTSKVLMRNSPHRDLLIRNERMTNIRGPHLTPVPFEDYDLHCRYHALETTNVAGWYIPTEFRLVLEPHQHEGRIVGVDVVGRADHVSQVDATPTFHPPSGKMSVTDLRVRDKAHLVDAVVYELTNAPIPATNDPSVERAMALAISRAALDPVPAIRRRMVVFYFMICGLVILSIVVIGQRVRQK